MGNYQKLFAQAQRSIASVAGIQVTYSRGEDSVTVTAVPGVSDFSADGQQFINEYTTRDYMIAASDLVLNGEVITPKKDDTISEEVGSSTHLYRVGRPDTGTEQPWRYTDTGRSTIRVHSVLKSIG